MADEQQLRYTKEHEWLLETDGVIRIGITGHAVHELGDIVYVDLPDVGDEATAGEVIVEIESTKSVGEVFAPVSGEVRAVNDALDDDPALINAEPFDAGWVVEIAGSLDGVETLSYAEYQAEIA